MSRIDDLIADRCPSGVPSVPLESVAAFRKGEQLKIEDRVDGPFPVVTAGRTSESSHDDFNFDAGSVTVSSHGAYAGQVNYWSTPIWLSNNVFLLSTDRRRLTARYLYFVLQSRQDRVRERVRGGGVPYMNAKDLATLRLPLPPLEVQREIVRILDKFTQLEAELEAELEARRAQYEFYRRALLGAEDGDSLQPLGKLLISVRVPKGVKRGAYGDGSAIPIVDQGKSAIAGFTDDDSFRVPAGEHIVFGDHTRAVKWVDHDFAPGADGTRVFRAREGVLPRYAFFAFQQLDIPSRGYNRHWTVAREMTVPVPSLKRQREIVTILDQFDALVNDISIGLPAELTARHKQYEHYRDRLLTFQELAA